MLWPILSIIFLSLASCKFNDPPPANSILNGSAAGNGCQLNAEKIERFFEEIITSELDCIELSLLIYAQVDQRVRTSNVNKSELKQFLKVFVGSTQKQIDGTNILFFINHLIFDKNKNDINVDDIGALFAFLKEINRLAVPLVSLFEKLKPGILEKENTQNLENIFTHSQNLSHYLSQVFISSGQYRAGFNIEEILRKFLEGDKANMIDQITPLLFLKNVVMGGEEGVIEASESLHFFSQIPGIVRMIYRGISIGKVAYNNSFGDLASIREIVLEFKSHLHHRDGENERYFHYNKIMNLSYLVPNFEFSSIENSIKEFKHSKILGSEKQYDHFTYKNFATILDHCSYVLSKTIYSNKNLDQHHSIIHSKKGINFDKLDSLLKEESDFKASLVQMLKDYRILRDSTLVPTYDHQINFPNFGMGEVVVFDHLAKIFFETYSTAKSKSEFKKENLQGLINRYQDLIVELKMWRNPPEKLVETIYLMTDYLRLSSDSDGKIDISEVVEFAVMALSSGHITSRLYQGLDSQCREEKCNYNHEQQGVPTKYFYENSFALFKRFQSSFELLFNEFQTSSKAWTRYIENVATFARVCPYDYKGATEVNIKEKDFGQILSGLISIEEIFIGFDKNQSGILEYNELEVAEIHFKPLVMDLGKLSEGEKYLTKSIFFYLVTKKRVPSSIDAITFYAEFNLIKNQSKISADREVISQVLTNFASIEDLPEEDCYIDKPLPW
jgi:hypothetical protein